MIIVLRIAAHFFPINALILCFFIISCSPIDDRVDRANQENATEDSLSYSNKTFFSDCEKLYHDARKLDSLLLQQMEVDKKSAELAIKAFANYANYCHQDSISPVFLIKCAQVARSINNIPQAKLALEKCINDFPNFRDRPAALFLLAQLYDEDTYLNDESEARLIYEDIINNYPKSDWAISAKGAILFLGKSDEEIMRELKKKK